MSKMTIDSGEEVKKLGILTTDEQRVISKDGPISGYF